MNRYLLSSAIIGASAGMLHGRMNRKETIVCIRDGVIGAALYPFVIPIAAYQLYVNANSSCIFTKSKSKTLTETPVLQ